MFDNTFDLGMALNTLNKQTRLFSQFKIQTIQGRIIQAVGYKKKKLVTLVADWDKATIVVAKYRSNDTIL